MADYIHKNIICAAYVHVEIDGLDTEGRTELLNSLKSFALQRAKFFLYDDIEIDVDSKEGSLKVYMTILGTLGALYHGVAEYPHFKEGAMAIYDDSKRMSEVMVSEILFESKARGPQIVRSEARTGIVGSLRKLIGELEAVRAANGIQTQSWMAERLTRASKDAQTLLNNLNAEGDKILVANGLTEVVEQLPHVPQAPKKGRPFEHAIANYKSERRRLLGIVKQNK
jgi:hypothetical protein